MLKILSAVLVLASLQGCAVIRDSRDAAWDPPQGRSLFEQLPNWDRAAQKLCGAHLRESERSVGMTDRC
jgi:hypothetical protein